MHSRGGLQLCHASGSPGRRSRGSRNVGYFEGSHPQPILDASLPPPQRQNEVTEAVKDLLTLCSLSSRQSLIQTTSGDSSCRELFVPTQISIQWLALLVTMPLPYSPRQRAFLSPPRGAGHANAIFDSPSTCKGTHQQLEAEDGHPSQARSISYFSDSGRLQRRLVYQLPLLRLLSLLQ